MRVNAQVREATTSAKAKTLARSMSMTSLVSDVERAHADE